MSGFKEIVGHKNIIQYIENVSSSDMVSHAYILNGERGSGKRLLADFLLWLYSVRIEMKMGMPVEGVIPAARR